MKKALIALFIASLSIAIYFFSTKNSYQNLHYFTPLAKSFLQAKLDVEPSPQLNELVPFQDKHYVVYPPMPAVALVPFVAVFGETFNQKWASIIIAGLSVALFYLLLDRFTTKKWIKVSLTALLGFGTNFYFTSLSGTSWYFAHVCAVFFSILSLLLASSKRPFLSGLFLGASFLSRLPTILNFPILLYLLFEKIDKKNRAGVLTNFCAAVFLAIIIYGLYNFFRFGSVAETGYSLIPGIMDEPWFSKGVFDFSYLFRNLKAAFASFPQISTHFPYFVPSNYATAIYISTPALVLLLLTKIREGRVLFLILSVILSSLPGLTHATVGFTQFGYRFSLDYIVLLILILVFSFQKVGWKIALPLVGISIAINLYVVYLYKLGIFGY
ncbi:MAG: hypothetical protein BWY43_00582 [candidate division WS2 bacterium ADurb.Bin280]|uniref:Glycosyltransferase RgtA/B/C/D-like domain-containing protein n=1 Tax=candidate division WS2 bacterium ADurb.Bin280 TaxID=1852829 RepID=A0A1V5SCP9_9BACT|nr:MAG: hypothetical protein BWY43_00582 [candidate division WS2 bacterium ADurb.Bin280]